MARAVSGLRRWAYNLSGFNKYGLHHNDVLHEDEVVSEALRRLPKHLQDERNFRLMRAVQLSIQKSILPKEQWTKCEEDNRYLEPYIKEVEKELAEKKAFDE